MGTLTKYDKHELVDDFNPFQNISQVGLLSPKNGKIKNAPNQQPAKYDKLLNKPWDAAAHPCNGTLRTLLLPLLLLLLATWHPSRVHLDRGTSFSLDVHKRLLHASSTCSWPSVNLGKPKGCLGLMKPAKSKCRTGWSSKVSNFSSLAVTLGIDLENPPPFGSIPGFTCSHICG